MRLAPGAKPVPDPAVANVVQNMSASVAVRGDCPHFRGEARENGTNAFGPEADRHIFRREMTQSPACEQLLASAGTVAKKRRPLVGLVPWVVCCSTLAVCRPLVADEPALQFTPEVQEAGIRRISGKHLSLFTDLPSTPAVDELPEVFDQAFPQWCKYFGASPARLRDWHATGCLMRDKTLFKRLKLLPDVVPPFDNGFSYNYDLWVVDQTSDYYRRHLLLHEGVHSFMNTVLGSCGPPWYQEGMAELLGTHRWQDGELTVGYFPAHREETPMWGRIKIVRDAFAARRAKRFPDVLAYDPATEPGTEPYGWCWAAAAFLDGHPRYQARFRTLGKIVRHRDFNDRFRRLLGADWDCLLEEWQVFVADLEYGYDFQRTAIDFARGKPLEPSGRQIVVRADRGWQNSGVSLEAGVDYELIAQGRYQVANQPQIWWCEPNGVSIRYYRGRPLGILLAAIRPDEPFSGPCPFLAPTAVGLKAVLTPKRSGTLFLRINDSAAELADNSGTLAVRVQARPRKLPGD